MSCGSLPKSLGKSKRTSISLTIRKPFHVQLHRRYQAGFVQQRRMQEIGHCSKLVAHFVNERGGVIDEPPSFRIGNGIHFIFQTREVHAQCDKKLPCAVMQFPRECDDAPRPAPGADGWKALGFTGFGVPTLQSVLPFGFPVFINGSSFLRPFLLRLPGVALPFAPASSGAAHSRLPAVFPGRLARPGKNQLLHLTHALCARVRHRKQKYEVWEYHRFEDHSSACDKLQNHPYPAS